VVGLVVGLATANLEFGVRFPNEGTRENGSPPCVKVPGSSRSHPTRTDFNVLGTAVINNNNPGWAQIPAGLRERERERESEREKEIYCTFIRNYS
jgi:hypothetical protein